MILRNDCYNNHCLNNFLSERTSVCLLLITQQICSTTYYKMTCICSESYHFSRENVRDDIAILKLTTPLVFNDKVSAVKLPPQGEMETGDAVLSGWGSISKDILPILPAVLQKVTVPIIDNASCLQKFPKDGITGRKPELYNTQICTDSTRGESACSVYICSVNNPLNIQCDSNKKNSAVSLKISCNFFY